MNIKEYYSESDERLRVEPAQASRFAKEVANDFNPLHDPDAKRFCVPGDLLFSIVLSKYGLSEKMCFTFTGMVGGNVDLIFPQTVETEIDIADSKGKTYLQVDREGAVCTDPSVIDAFSHRYVAFSGHNFPDTLVPLLAEHGLMINPERPLVIYESMSLRMQSLEISDPHLELAGTRLDANGKRGEVFLDFRVFGGERTLGTGFKKLVLGGLQAYDAERIDKLVDEYHAWKEAYRSS